MSSLHFINDPFRAPSDSFQIPSMIPGSGISQMETSPEKELSWKEKAELIAASLKVPEFHVDPSIPISVPEWMSPFQLQDSSLPLAILLIL